MNAAPLCSLATVSTGGKAHINHMYFAWSGWFDVYWISDADSIHSKNLLRNRSAAITVYDSKQTWGKPDRGMQLFGRAGVVTGRAAGEAASAYAKRF
jgi:general stress protein 26